MGTRQVINATVRVEVDAEDETEAYERFCDGLDAIVGLVDTTVMHVEQTEKPYHVPTGAERWADAAKEIRFDESRFGDERRFGMYDGSWWWTDGHVMLRCEGAPPAAEAGKWRQVPDADVAKAVEGDGARVPSHFEPVMTESGRQLQRSVTVPTVAMTDAFCRLARTRAFSWRVPENHRSAIHGLDVEGRLVAVVMPYRLDLEPLAAPRKP